MLKVVGGSFGTGGSVSVSHQKSLIFVGSKVQKTYSFNDVSLVDMETESDSKISVGSVLVGLLIITPVLTLMFSIIGLIVGLAITVLGSKYSVKKHSATITFNDGKSVRVSGSRREIDALSDLR